MKLKYILHKLNQNDPENEVRVKIFKGTKELDGELLDLYIRDVGPNEIEILITLGKIN